MKKILLALLIAFKVHAAGDITAEDVCLSAYEQLRPMGACPSGVDPSTCVSFSATLKMGSGTNCQLEGHSNFGVSAVRSGSAGFLGIDLQCATPGSCAPILADASIAGTVSHFIYVITDDVDFSKYDYFRLDYVPAGAGSPPTVRKRIYFSDIACDGFSCAPSGYAGSTGAGNVPAGGTATSNGALDANNNDVGGAGPVSPGMGSPTGAAGQNTTGTGLQDGSLFSCTLNPKADFDSSSLNLGWIILGVVALATTRRKKI